MTRRKSKPNPDAEVADRERSAESQAEVPEATQEPVVEEAEAAPEQAQEPETSPGSTDSGEDEAEKASEPAQPAEQEAEPDPPPSRVVVKYSAEARHPGMLAGRRIEPGEVHTVSWGAYLAAKQANPAHYQLVGPAEEEA